MRYAGATAIKSNRPHRKVIYRRPGGKIAAEFGRHSRPGTIVVKSSVYINMGKPRCSGTSGVGILVNQSTFMLDPCTDPPRALNRYPPRLPQAAADAQQNRIIFDT
jgi:hypothetical protein